MYGANKFIFICHLWPGELSWCTSCVPFLFQQWNSDWNKFAKFKKHLKHSLYVVRVLRCHAFAFVIKDTPEVSLTFFFTYAFSYQPSHLARSHNLSLTQNWWVSKWSTATRTLQFSCAQKQDFGSEFSPQPEAWSHSYASFYHFTEQDSSAHEPRVVCSNLPVSCKKLGYKK